MKQSAVTYLTVGLFGTINTMDAEFFKKPFESNQIEVLIPTDEEKKFVNQKILEELAMGSLNK